MPERPPQQTRAIQGNVLGFDFGTKRIGVAIGQTITASARPLTTLANKNNRPDWQGLAELIEQWQAQALIIGLPLEKDGQDGDISRRARAFARQINERHPLLPTALEDERYSSAAARDWQRQQTGKKTPYDKDSLAAAYILEQWLQNRSD